MSSSIYPAIISGIQNKEMALMADAIAQLQEKNSRGDSSGYHVNIHASDTPSSSSSPTPATAAPSLMVHSDNAKDNKDFTSQAALGSLTARPTNNIVNTNSFYDVVFITSTPGTIKRIQVTFSAGTTVPINAFFNEADGIGPGAVSKSGQTITYTVTNAVNVPAGTKIRLEFANINNPLNPNANYKVTVTTRNAANAIIDGPTQSTAYNIKQIGSNAIANKAITSSKLSLRFAHIVWQDTATVGIVNTRNTISSPTPYTDIYTPSALLSNRAFASLDPSIAASGDNVYVVWTQSLDVMYRRSTDGGSTFGGEINLSNSDSSNFPVIAASGDNVYVVWMDDSSEILFRRSTNAGATFSSAVNLSNNAGGSTLPSIAASGNNVYVMWSDSTPGNIEILYRRSTNAGATFSSAVNLSNNAGSSSSPDVAVSGSNVYVVWHDITPANNEIFYRRSINGGTSFGATDNLSNNAGSSASSSVAASGNNVYVMWIDNTPGNNEILFRSSANAGATFGNTLNLSNSGGNSQTAAMAASGTNVYVLWDDNTLGTIEVLSRRSTDSGARFGDPINLSANTFGGAGGINPSIALS